MLFPVGNDKLVAMSEIASVSHSRDYESTSIRIRGDSALYTLPDPWGRLFREICIAAAKEREPITLEAMR